MCFDLVAQSRLFIPENISGREHRLTAEATLGSSYRDSLEDDGFPPPLWSMLHSGLTSSRNSLLSEATEVN